jgi:hypothetical protein
MFIKTREYCNQIIKRFCGELLEFSSSPPGLLLLSAFVSTFSVVHFPQIPPACSTEVNRSLRYIDYS